MIRPTWEAEIREFVFWRKIFGRYAPHLSEWKLGKCMRCEGSCGLGFDAYIPACEACRPLISKITGERE